MQGRCRMQLPSGASNWRFTCCCCRCYTFVFSLFFCCCFFIFLFVFFFFICLFYCTPVRQKESPLLPRVSSSISACLPAAFSRLCIINQFTFSLTTRKNEMQITATNRERCSIWGCRVGSSSKEDWGRGRRRRLRLLRPKEMGQQRCSSTTFHRRDLRALKSQPPELIAINDGGSK